MPGRLRAAVVGGSSACASLDAGVVCGSCLLWWLPRIRSSAAVAAHTESPRMKSSGRSRSSVSRAQGSSWRTVSCVDGAESNCSDYASVIGMHAPTWCRTDDPVLQRHQRRAPACLLALWLRNVDHKLLLVVKEELKATTARVRVHWCCGCAATLSLRACTATATSVPSPQTHLNSSLSRIVTRDFPALRIHLVVQWYTGRWGWGKACVFTPTGDGSLTSTCRDMLAACVGAAACASAASDPPAVSTSTCPPTISVC